MEAIHMLSPIYSQAAPCRFHRSSIGPYILYMNEWFDQIPYRIVSGYTQEKIHMNRNEAFPHIIPFI